MRNARILAVYVAVVLAATLILSLLSMVPVFAHESFLFIIVELWIVLPIGIAVARRLTGWPPKPSPANLPLPLRGSANGTWTVTVDEPGWKRYRLRWFLIYERGLSPNGARAAASSRKGPVLIGTSMSWDDATTFADELRSRGASVSVNDGADESN